RAADAAPSRFGGASRPSRDLRLGPPRSSGLSPARGAAPAGHRRPRGHGPTEPVAGGGRGHGGLSHRRSALVHLRPSPRGGRARPSLPGHSRAGFVRAAVRGGVHHPSPPPHPHPHPPP